MGLFNWFRKFNNNYSTVAQPILKQTKKNMKFDWTNAYEIAFKGLKLLLQNSSIFTCYDLDFRLAVDILCHELWYMLYQINEGESNKVVRFGSKELAIGKGHKDQPNLNCKEYTLHSQILLCC